MDPFEYVSSVFFERQKPGLEFTSSRSNYGKYDNSIPRGGSKTETQNKKNDIKNPDNSGDTATTTGTDTTGDDGPEKKEEITTGKEDNGKSYEDGYRGPGKSNAMAERARKARLAAIKKQQEQDDG